MSETTQQSLQSHRRGLILLIIAALLWSFGGLLIKSVQAAPLAVAGLRSMIALPILCVILRPSHLSFSRDQILGAVFYCATVTLFVMANKYTTAANAILLQYTAPIYVAILSILILREPVSRFDWLAIGLAFVGMGLFFVDEISIKGLQGNLFAILSGISFALMVIFLRKQKQSFPLGSIVLGNLLTAVISAGSWLSARLDGPSWLALILLGTFQLGLSYAMYSAAIRHVSAIEAIMIPVIEPILNPIWVLLFLHEIPSPWTIPGGLLVLFAAALCGVMRLRQQNKGRIP
jgi:drug/metabolite transporter (DMT)-like permease